MIPMQPFGSPGGASSSSSIMMSSPVGGAASPEDHDLAVLKVCVCRAASAGLHHNAL